MKDPAITRRLPSVFPGVWPVLIIIFVMIGIISGMTRDVAASSIDGEPLAELTHGVELVEVQPGGEGDWISVEVPHLLYMGDRVRTGPGSRSVIVFADGSQVRMSERTTLEITYRLGVEEEAPGIVARIRLFFGQIFNRIQAGRSSLEIESPDAIAAVRGTEFFVTVDALDDVDLNLLGRIDFESWRAMYVFQTRLVVSDGLVAFFNALGEVEVGEGQASASSSNAPPGEPAAATADEIRQLYDTFQDQDVDGLDASQTQDDPVFDPAMVGADDSYPDDIIIHLLTTNTDAFNPKIAPMIVRASLSHPSPWRITIVHNDLISLSAGVEGAVRTFSGKGDHIEIEWDGTSSDDPENVIADGDYTIVLEVVDSTNHVFVSETTSIVVDTVAPALAYSLPEDGAVVFAYPDSMTAIVDETGSGLVVDALRAWVNGVERPLVIGDDPNSVVISVTPDDLIEGTNAVHIRLLDRAGNETTVTWMFVLSLTPLEILHVNAEPRGFSPALDHTIELWAVLSKEADWKWTIVRIDDGDYWAVDTEEGWGKTISYTWDGQHDPTLFKPWDPSPGGIGAAFVVSPPTQIDGHYLFVVEAWTDADSGAAADAVDFLVDTEPPYVAYTWIDDGDVVPEITDIEVGIVDLWSPIDVESVEATLNGDVIPATVSELNNSDFSVGNGYGVKVVADFQDALRSGQYVYTLTFADAVGNEGQYEITFRVANDPVVTSVDVPHIVLPYSGEASVRIAGSDLAGATIFLQRQGSMSFPVKIDLAEEDVDPDEGGATLLLDGTFVRPGLYRVTAGSGDPLSTALHLAEVEDAPTLLVTRSEASGDHPSLIHTRNDLGRTGTGLGPKSIDAWSARMLTWGLSGLSSIVMTDEHLILRTDKNLHFRSMSGGKSVDFNVGGGPWSPAPAIMEDEIAVYFYDVVKRAIGRVSAGARNPRYFDIGRWTTVNDLLIHKGLLVVIGQSKGVQRLVVADAKTGDVIHTESLSIVGQARRFVVSDGGLGRDPVLHVYGDGGVYSLDLYTFKPLWHDAWDGVAFGMPPVLAVDRAGGHIYALVALHNRSMLYAYDAQTGHRWLDMDLIDTGVGPLARFDEEGLAVSDGRAFMLIASGSTAAFVTVSGTEVANVVFLPGVKSPGGKGPGGKDPGGKGTVTPGPLAVSPMTDHAYMVVTDDHHFYMYVVEMENDGTIKEIPLSDLVDESKMRISTIKAAQNSIIVAIDGHVYRLTYDGKYGVEIADPPLLKTANRSHAQIGDVITYTITFDNTRPIDEESLVLQTNVVIEDVLPPGFVYVEGSSYMYPDGLGGSRAAVQIADPSGARTLYWELASPVDPIEVGSRRSLTYQVVVGPRSATGTEHTNRAIAFFDGDGDGMYVVPCEPDADPLTDACDFPLTNVARSDVYVTTGVFTPQTIIVGKVFHDRNKDGRQNPGEPGIADVQIVTERGVTITTDENGLFHWAPRSPGRHVLRLDERSLPIGMYVTARGATRLLDTALGGLFTVNFVVEGE